MSSHYKVGDHVSWNSEVGLRLLRLLKATVNRRHNWATDIVPYTK